MSPKQHPAPGVAGGAPAGSSFDTLTPEQRQVELSRLAGGPIAITDLRPAELHDIDSVIEHPENARDGDVGAICESITANGVYKRITVQRATPGGEVRMRVIAGNHTRRAAKSLGFRLLPMEFVVCTDARARKILLADNRTNDRASYRKDELAELLQLTAKDDGGLGGTAWDGDDLDTLLQELAASGAGALDAEWASDIEQKVDDIAMSDAGIPGKIIVRVENAADVEHVRPVLVAALKDLPGVSVD